MGRPATRAEVERWLESARAAQDPLASVWVRALGADWERTIEALQEAREALEKIAGDRALGRYHKGFLHEPMCGCDHEQNDPLCQVGIARAALPERSEAP